MASDLDAGMATVPADSIRLRRLDRAAAMLSELAEAYGDLLAGHQPGGDICSSYAELDNACELIASAHTTLMRGWVTC